MMVAVWLMESEGRITGRYAYAKHLKFLTLEGKWDPRTGNGILTESWEGKQTGHFRFSLKEETLNGEWWAPSQQEKKVPFVLKKVGEYQEKPPIRSDRFGGIYQQHHEVAVNGIDEKGR